MRHRHDFQRITHGRPERRGYRPEHAWLGTPGDGPTLRNRRPHAPWHFRWLQLRILIVAALVCWLAWSQLAGRPAHPVAGASAKR